ncbi:Hpt domain-containing protein, partial [Dyella choica]
RCSQTWLPAYSDPAPCRSGIYETLLRLDANQVRPEELYATLARWLDLPPAADQAPDEPLPPRWRRACIDADVQEYERALARQDTANMVRFAHRAKGAALVLHADRAAELADRLELAARGYAPLQPDEIQRTLAALKAAIARHFD